MTDGLGRTLSTKHFPLGRTNLRGLRSPGLRTGLTGAAACASTSAPSGSSGSIQGDVTSDLVRFVVFLGFRISVDSVRGLTSGHTEVSQRLITDADSPLPWLDVTGPAWKRYSATGVNQMPKFYFHSCPTFVEII